MRVLVSSLLAGMIALSAAAPAFAEPQRYGYDRGYDRWDDRRDNRWERRDDRRNYKDGYRDGRRDDGRYYNNRGWDDRRWDNYRWRKGDRFDRRDYRYVVVTDYGRYRDRYGYPLRHPGRGHYYVRDDRTGEILLIAAATGLVLWALNN